MEQNEIVNNDLTESKESQETNLQETKESEFKEILFLIVDLIIVGVYALVVGFTYSFAGFGLFSLVPALIISCAGKVYRDKSEIINFLFYLTVIISFGYFIYFLYLIFKIFLIIFLA